MSEAAKEKTYSEAEIKARLQQELPRWVYEGGWIRRTYKTASWKGTLMVINTVGHLAEAAWHHPDLTASYAWVEVRLQNHAAKGITDKDFELAKKIEEVVLWQPGKLGGALEGTPTDQRFAISTIKKAKHRCAGANFGRGHSRSGRSTRDGRAEGGRDAPSARRGRGLPCRAAGPPGGTGAL